MGEDWESEYSAGRIEEINKKLAKDLNDKQKMWMFERIGKASE